MSVGEVFMLCRGKNRAAGALTIRKERCSMGIYLNPGNEKFFRAVHSEIYVDKTGLLEYTNKVMNTSQQNICVSRPRRFGK